MVKHNSKDALVLFSKEIAQAVTGMTAGVMNYLGGRPRVSKSIHLYSYLIDKNLLNISVNLNNKKYIVAVNPHGEVPKKPKENRKIIIINKKILDTTIPLFKIAYARSGDKGDHANIGVIAREKEYLPYIQNALTSKKVSSYFSHFMKGDLKIWDVPGISGINFLLKNSLGGGGMASFNIDPQGKSYAQQLLEIEIPIPSSLKDKINYE